MSLIVDLSHALSPSAPRSSDHPEVAFAAVRTFARHGLSTRTIFASLHAGTHMDAARLYLPQGQTISDIPISRLYGPGIVVGIPKDEWGIITAGDLEASGDIRPGDNLVIYTGWSRYYGVDEERYVLRGPGLDKSGVDWLIERKVNAVCADLASSEHVFCRTPQWKTQRPDLFGHLTWDKERFPLAGGHIPFFQNDILLADNIGGDVASIAGRRCTIGIMVAKYAGVEGAPARVFAIVD
jgi:kynurenine formamidase